MSGTAAQARPGFQELQYRFAAHLRDPAANAAPAGIEDRRLKIYRELFFNNAEGFLANAFPVLRRITADADWLALVREFYAVHQSQDPLFHGLAGEFLRYLDEERGERAGDWPFLRELAHYEWVELALSVAEDQLSPQLADPNGDLLTARPLVSPLAWTFAYDWPVHRIGPDHLPETAPEQPTLLIVWRTRNDAIKFMEINAVTARLMELLAMESSASGGELLAQIAAELGHPQPEQVIAQGAGILRSLRQRDIVLGSQRLA